ncbi:MAG TPA: protein kinase, partial [Kofleriaceae bacterium]|nr:protein kinase [Kofleriaceae bacterium]
HELRNPNGKLYGLVHRDVSPANIMVSFDGVVKLCDFGIAKAAAAGDQLTNPGQVKGKYAYMSPEQTIAAPLDGRSDVFSLAIVLWELLTATGLFDGDSIYAVARSVEHQVIRPPSQVLGVALPLGLDAAVMSALERDLGRRTETAAAFAEELEQVIQGAGDETLEAWADRVLEDARNAHRAWLASVVAGRGASRPIGRATGSVTALAPAPGKAATMVAPSGSAQVPSSAGVPVVRVATHLEAPDDDELDVPPRRSLALPLLLGVAVLALVGGGIALVRRAAAPPGPRDAAVVDLPNDARVDDAAPRDGAVDAVADAAVPVDAPADAPADAPVDAGRHPVRAPRDAGRTVGRDAALAVPGATVIDAAVLGFGTLTAKHKNDRYLNVVLDGQQLGPTPLFGHKIPAGTHVIELVDALNSKVVVRRTVTVEPGGSVTVSEP